MFERLITSAIISSRILRIVDERLNRIVRPTLNLFIKKPFGFGFSTMARELEEKGYVNYINDYSVPGIVGTVRGGRIYRGSLADSGYKLTIFDEVMMLDNKSKKVILELSEHLRASRDIQGFIERRQEITFKGGKYVADYGKLIIEVHTSFVFGTASDSALNDPDIKMLLSRCFCLNIKMDVEEAIKLKKEGRELIVNEKVIPEEPIEEIRLPEDVNDFILEKMMENTIVDESEGGYYTRCHDDMIRLSAVHCVARGDTIISEKDAKFALQFYKLHQLGFLGSQLSTNALKVLQYCNGHTIDEITKLTKLSKRTVYRHIRQLMESNLVAKIGNRYYTI